ncbi:MAG: zinc ribbon domain-containing protein [Bryobacteraceae bacterium]
MFTWICPKCGREVPPSYTDCPNCTVAQAPPPQAPAAAPPVYAPPAPPVYAPPPPAAYAPPQPPPAYAPPQPAYAPPPAAYAQPAYAPPPAAPYAEPQRAMPEWLVMVIVAVVAVGIFALAYFYLLPSSRKGSSGAAVAKTQSEETRAAIGAHPYAKFLDVTGIRLVEDAKQNVQVRFLVVNHSSADLAGVSANVILKPIDSKPDTPPITEFSFKLPMLGAYESREVTVPAKTKMRAYELPDWQFLKSEVHITTPK